MKVFMSWSGGRSHAVAKLLGDWLEDVIQAVKPWISSAGIDRGEQWFRKIGDNLAEVSIGIVCLTPENKENPWIMFEAGALLKGSPEARVMTYLIDLKHQDVRDPLAQFNHTTPAKTDMFALVTTLNSLLKDGAITDAKLATGFETYWPQFEQKFQAIMNDYKPESVVEERPQGEILTEVLETVRGLKKQLNRMDTSGMMLELEDGAGELGMSHSVPLSLMAGGVPNLSVGLQVARNMALTGNNQLAIQRSLFAYGFSKKSVKEILEKIEGAPPMPPHEGLV
jgi:hypothetical protein